MGMTAASTEGTPAPRLCVEVGGSQYLVPHLFHPLRLPSKSSATSVTWKNFLNGAFRISEIGQLDQLVDLLAVGSQEDITSLT